MWKKEITKKKRSRLVSDNFFEHSWGESWTYIETVVDATRDPVLILDKDFRVLAANESFYITFNTNSKDIEGKIVYKLGNGEWNIPALKNLLKDVLPKNTFFRGFEVSQYFPAIGNKRLILNARKVYFDTNNDVTKIFSSFILLVIEDVTEMMNLAEMLARHNRQF